MLANQDNQVTLETLASLEEQDQLGLLDKLV